MTVKAVFRFFVADRRMSESIYYPGMTLMDSGFRRNDDRVDRHILAILILYSSPLRHSSESRNPVVYTIHSRLCGNDNEAGMTAELSPDVNLHFAFGLFWHTIHDRYDYRP